MRNFPSCFLIALMASSSTLSSALPLPHSTNTPSFPLPEAGHSQAEILSHLRHDAITIVIMPRSDSTNPPDRTYTTRDNGDEESIASVVNDDIATFAGSPFSGTEVAKSNETEHNSTGTMTGVTEGNTTAMISTVAGHHPTIGLHLLNGTIASLPIPLQIPSSFHNGTRPSNHTWRPPSGLAPANHTTSSHVSSLEAAIHALAGLRASLGGEPVLPRAETLPSEIEKALLMDEEISPNAEQTRMARVGNGGGVVGARGESQGLRGGRAGSNATSHARRRRYGSSMPGRRRHP